MRKGLLRGRHCCEAALVAVEATMQGTQGGGGGVEW